MYEAQRRAVKKAQEKKFNLSEIGILRWMCEIVTSDGIRNKLIRRTTKVVELPITKMQESN